MGVKFRGDRGGLARCPYKGSGGTGTRGQGPVKEQRLEGRVHKPQDTRDQQRPPEAGSGREDPPPEDSEGARPRPALEVRVWAPELCENKFHTPAGGVRTWAGPSH